MRCIRYNNILVFQECFVAFRCEIIILGELYILWGWKISVSVTENTLGCTVLCFPKSKGDFVYSNWPRSRKKGGFTTLWLPQWQYGVMPGKVAELHLYFGRDYGIAVIGPREVLPHYWATNIQCNSKWKLLWTFTAFINEDNDTLVDPWFTQQCWWRLCVIH